LQVVLLFHRAGPRAEAAIPSPNGIGVQQVETSIPQGEPGDRLRFMNGKSERLFVCNRSIHLLVLCKAWYFDLGKLEQQKMMNPKLFA